MQTCRNGDVCSTPESGHVRCTSSCLLWANSGHAEQTVRKIFGTKKRILAFLSRLGADGVHLSIHTHAYQESLLALAQGGGRSGSSRMCRRSCRSSTILWRFFPIQRVASPI